MLRLRFTASLLALSLAACAGGQWRPSGEVLRNDRAVIRALTLLEVPDATQAKVLEAFDVDAVRRREIDRELQTLDSERALLDPRQSDFLARSEAWAERLLSLQREKIGIQARFDHAVASLLSERQWRDWQQLVTPRQTGYGDYRDYNGVPSRGP